MGTFSDKRVFNGACPREGLAPAWGVIGAAAPVSPVGHKAVAPGAITQSTRHVDFTYGMLQKANWCVFVIVSDRLLFNKY